MSDKPILFSAPMVRALLAGTKTQTRRIAPKQPTLRPDGLWDHHGYEYGISAADEATLGAWMADFQRVQRGDRLYVREQWRTESKAYDDLAPGDMDADYPVIYEADAEWALNKTVGRFRQGMHMPRWASRITLTVTDVRVQRLQDISREDAIAEGTPCYVCGRPMDGLSEADCHCFHRKADASDCRNLWEEINGPGSWDGNPWVSAYTFTVHRCNIDQMGRAA